MLFCRVAPSVLAEMGSCFQESLASCSPQRAQDLRGSGVLLVLVEKIWGSSAPHKARWCGLWPAYMARSVGCSCRSCSGALCLGWGCRGGHQPPAPLCAWCRCAGRPSRVGFLQLRLWPGSTRASQPSCPLDQLESLPSGVLGCLVWGSPCPCPLLGSGVLGPDVPLLPLACPVASLGRSTHCSTDTRFLQPRVEAAVTGSRCVEGTCHAALGVTSCGHSSLGDSFLVSGWQAGS